MAGSLTVVGSGIDAVLHLTPETEACIKAAEIVYFCVCDPVAQIVIMELNSNCVDLFPFYSEDVPRYVTYRKMTNVVVGSVRRGLNVCMVFYGHPGVCATSPHAAIAEVRKFGAPARMLPSISSHDAMFAELGIDPGLLGCQIYEATSYLTRERKYDVNTPLVLYQLGAIGDINFYLGGFPKICMHLLIETLGAQYGVDHGCVLYSAPNTPFSKPEIIRCTIGAIDQSVVRMAHTLYLPPKGEPPRKADMIERIHSIRDEYYVANGRPTKGDWPQNSETFDEHPGAKAYDSAI